MGTDIHSIAQVRHNNSWNTVAIGIIGDLRSYNMFAMLADVRNGRGFAGVKTSDRFPVIHEPRGLPEDLQADNDKVPVDVGRLVTAWDWDGHEVQVDSEKARRVRYLSEDDQSMWLGEHSHSWCTLAELQAFADNIASKTETHLAGVVTRKQYDDFKTNGTPYDGWCGMVYGPGIVVQDENALTPEATHVHTRWPVNAAEASQLPNLIAALQKLATQTGVGADDLRFVFGFDS